jgi:midasin
MIRALASIVGASLQELSMNGGTDTADILGGYEQQDHNRRISQLASEIQQQIHKVLGGSRSPLDTQLCKIIELVSMLPCSGKDAPLLYTDIRTALHVLDLRNSELSDKLTHCVDLLAKTASESGSGKFLWHDGILIDALIRGDWIILENANLCNPSVLDRLNSLLEPAGSLVLHESPSVNGEPRVIRPHPNFRLFLTVDPRYGELSRAMRNRAVEVAIDRHENGFGHGTFVTKQSDDRYVSG